MTLYIHRLSAVIALAAIAQPLNAASPPTASGAAALDTVAFEITEQLTREIGARQGGTAAEQRARDWAMKKLNSMGFANVREESFMMPTWVRGEEKASIVAPIKMDLSVTALGNSAATGITPLKGQIAYFRTFDALTAASDAEVKGKIVFVDHDMTRTQDGSSYGYFGRARFQGPTVAAKKGAIAIIVRSAGTANHDHPHTGNTNFENGVAAIPSAAISNEDADKFVAAYWKAWQIGRRPSVDMTKKPASLEVQLLLTPKNLGQQKSGNVIAEVTGTNPSLPPILIACRLDSWDLATGAFDDAAGCGIITAAAQHI